MSHTAIMKVYIALLMFLSVFAAVIILIFANEAMNHLFALITLSNMFYLVLLDVLINIFNKNRLTYHLVYKSVAMKFTLTTLIVLQLLAHITNFDQVFDDVSLFWMYFTILFVFVSTICYFMYIFQHTNKNDDKKTN